MFGIGKLADQETYYYIMTTYNKVEVESENSDAVWATTKARPQSPSGIAGENQGKKVLLRWTKNPGGEIVAYCVYEKSPSGLKKIDTVKVNSFTDGAPDGGKSRTYVITAVDKDDIESEPSTEVTLTGIRE